MTELKPDAGASEGPLQFGRREAGGSYPDRPAAFGIALRDDRIALARITREGEEPYVDLPGGGIDPGEDAATAAVREFGEETGLVVRAGREITRFSQYLMRTSGEPANNRCTVFEMELAGEDPALKCEDDHTLVWVDPEEAARTLRLDGHAWAVLAWLRGREG